MLKNILSGIGSALVLFPASGYTHFRPAAEHDFNRTDREALKSDVRSIGADFYKALEEQNNNVKKTKTARQNPAA